MSTIDEKIRDRIRQLNEAKPSFLDFPKEDPEKKRLMKAGKKKNGDKKNGDKDKKTAGNKKPFEKKEAKGNGNGKKDGFFNGGKYPTGEKYPGEEDSKNQFPTDKKPDVGAGAGVKCKPNLKAEVEPQTQEPVKIGGKTPVDLEPETKQVGPKDMEPVKDTGPKKKKNVFPNKPTNEGVIGAGKALVGAVAGGLVKTAAHAYGLETSPAIDVYRKVKKAWQETREPKAPKVTTGTGKNGDKKNGDKDKKTAGNKRSKKASQAIPTATQAATTPAASGWRPNPNSPMQQVIRQGQQRQAGDKAKSLGAHKLGVLARFRAGMRGGAHAAARQAGVPSSQWKGKGIFATLRAASQHQQQSKQLKQTVAHVGSSKPSARMTAQSAPMKAKVSVGYGQGTSPGKPVLQSLGMHTTDVSGYKGKFAHSGGTSASLTGGNFYHGQKSQAPVSTKMSSKVNPGLFAKKLINAQQQKAKSEANKFGQLTRFKKGVKRAKQPSMIGAMGEEFSMRKIMRLLHVSPQPSRSSTGHVGSPQQKEYQKRLLQQKQFHQQDYVQAANQQPRHPPPPISTNMSSRVNAGLLSRRFYTAARDINLATHRKENYHGQLTRFRKGVKPARQPSMQPAVLRHKTINSARRRKVIESESNLPLTKVLTLWKGLRLREGNGNAEGR
jgi:hypothetical protein